MLHLKSGSSLIRSWIRNKNCSNAVLHSLTEENYPKELRTALLRQWLRLRNLTTRSRESAIAFFPACPESYFELAEHFWSFRNSNSSAQGVLADAFIKYIFGSKDARVNCQSMRALDGVRPQVWQ